MNLRPYQREAIDATLAAIARHRSALVVMPTGTGKTVAFAKLIQEGPPGRALVIAHREELIAQAVRKIEAVTGETPEIEMADARADTHIFRKSRVVVASVQTLTAVMGSKRRMQRFDPAAFGLIVTDEAHHATANSYRMVYSHFMGGNPRCRHVGVTATPDRTDREALGQVFEKVAYVYEITRAIDDGYLVPITQRSVHVEKLDYSKVRTTAGDLNQADLARVMNDESILQEVVSASLEAAKWRKAIVFAPPGFKKGENESFRVSERMVEIFNRHRSGCAQLVSQDTPKEVRRDLVRDFAAKRFQFLVNVGVFTEGFDDPSIDMVIMARATKSRALYAQMIGRGTRPLDGLVDPIDAADARREAIRRSPKPNCEVLDFRGNAGTHKLITVADILGGKRTAAEVELAARKVEAAVGAVDVAAALDEAREELDAAARKAAAVSALRRRPVVARADFTLREIDPFNVFDLTPQRTDFAGVAEGPSERQAAVLERFGIPVHGGMTKGQADQLIGEAKQRFAQGKCSFKQARLLKKRGLSGDVSRDEAKAIIDAIATREGWKKKEGATTA